MPRPFRTAEDERDVFRAVAHPVRRKIIAAALDQPRTFRELQTRVRRREAALAGHLRILRQARVINATRHGKSVTYRTNPRALRSGAAWMTSIVTAEAKTS